ncbi:MAG: hypothetical protein KJ799_18505 [Bacteroidetes bacterium]|nr:hypothetical protein [Bacteroidota bacterium]
MKKFLFYPMMSLIFIMSHFLMSCNQDSFIVSVESGNGIRGVVRDTSGKALKDVKVFCLFYSYTIPVNLSISAVIERLSNREDFAFNLEQNFPNPFSNSTFLRFSLPTKAFVNLELIDKINNEIVYEFSDSLQAGYYQHYLRNIVDSLQLKNGAYLYTLNALVANDTNYSDTKELFIISNKSAPNSITNVHGQYEFNYNQIFEGDSVVVKFANNYTYTINLTNMVNILFEKEGYEPKIIPSTLYPNFVLDHDVVLIGER